VQVLRSGPGGDPRVYRVDGTEVAMRRDLSRHIHVELVGAPALGTRGWVFHDELP